MGSHMKTIKKAVKILESQTNLAKALGVRGDQIFKWINHIYFPSIPNMKKIEEVTGGQVKAIDILNEKMQIKLNKMERKVKE